MPRNEQMTFMHDDDGALISLFKSNDVTYPKVFHIGFLQDTPEQVRDIHAQLKPAATRCRNPGKTTGD